MGRDTKRLKVIKRVITAKSTPAIRAFCPVIQMNIDAAKEITLWNGLERTGFSFYS